MKKLTSVLRWSLLLTAAAAVFIGCSLETSEPYPDDPGQAVSETTGDVVVFARTPADSMPRIWSMFSNGTGQKALTDANTFGGKGLASLDVSADGSTVAVAVTQLYEAADGSPWDAQDVFVMNIDGSNLRNVSQWCPTGGDPSKCAAVLADPYSWEDGVSLNADGSQLLFHRNEIKKKDGKRIAGQFTAPDVFKLDLQTKQLSNLTNTASSGDLRPDWAPDGSRIAYITNRKSPSSGRPTSTHRLYTMSSTGTQRKRITSGAADLPQWQPDTDDDVTTLGKILYSKVVDGARNWNTINATGGGVEPVLSDSEHASWSPSGADLIYDQSRSDHADAQEIFKKPLDGAETRLTDYQGDDFIPAWADESPAPFVRAKNATVREGEATHLTFPVQLNRPAQENLAIDFSVVGVDALAGEDFVDDSVSDPLSGSVSFAPGDSAKTVTVEIIDDSIDEPTEDLKVTLTGVSTGTANIARATAIGLIEDDDPPPTVSVDDVDVDEGDGHAIFDVYLSAESLKTVTVDYTDVPGTATKPADYTGATGTLEFEPGETDLTVEVPINDDDVEETPDTETFDLTLSTPVNATKGDAGATATITDDDGVIPPGEEEIAFTRFSGSGGPSDIWTVPAEGGAEVQFEFGSVADGYDYEPNWGEGDNSHLLYFSSYGDESDADLYVRNVDTGVVTKVFNTDHATLGEAEEYEPVVTSDGTKVAFSSTYDFNGGNPPAVGGGVDAEIFVFTIGQSLSPTNPVQLTDNEVDDSSPTWSPTGDQIAYAQGHHGSSDLFLVAADGSSTPEQLTSETGGESHPDWSADGETIAFSGNQDGGDDDIYFLHNIGDTNDIEQVTFESASQVDPSFSPDGQLLAYSRDGDIVTLDIEACFEDQLTSGLDGDASPDWKNPGGIDAFDVPVSGCIDDGGGGGGETPIDGDIAFISARDGVDNIFSMDVDGLNQTNVTDSASAEAHVAWNHDGTKVAFARDDMLWERDTATGVESQIGWFSGDFSGIAWNPDPTQDALAFGYMGDAGQGSTTDHDIYIYDFNDSSLANMSDFSDTTIDDRMPDWSPDGSTIAFVSDADTAPNSTLYTMDVVNQDVGGFFAWVKDGESRRVSLAMNVADPDWSPNGGVIAFESTAPDNPGGDKELYALDATDETVYRITNNSTSMDDADPAWSPDGTSLLWAQSSGSGYDLRVADLTQADCTASSTALTAAPGNDWQGEWRPDAASAAAPPTTCMVAVAGTGPLSPSDAEIAFVRGDFDDSELWIARADGSQRTKLATIPGLEGHPEWSPDGTKIAFVSSASWDDDEEVFVLDVSSAATIAAGPVQISDEDALPDGAPTWTPDGSKVVWHSMDGSSFDYDIVWAAPDGTGSEQRIGADTLDDEMYPAFETDTDGAPYKMAFVSTRTGEDGPDGDTDPDWDTEIWKGDVDSAGALSNLSQMTNDDAVSKSDLAWAPSLRLLYVKGDNEDSEIWMHVFGANFQVTNNALFDAHPTWIDLDGIWNDDQNGYIVFTRQGADGNFDLYRQNAENLGTGPERLTTSSDRDWMPGGKW